MKKILISFIMIIITICSHPIVVAFEAGEEDIVVTCKNYNKTRLVTLDYLSKEESIPCQVVYEKPTEMPDYYRILWYAETELGYCEQKIDEFIRNQSEWGWDCLHNGEPYVTEEQISNILDF